MKISGKIFGLALAAVATIGLQGGFAQDIEYDDMYFNANDRAKLQSMRGPELASNDGYSSKRDMAAADYNINPTDSYSARNVNPEYTARAQSQHAQAEDAEYFVQDYQYRNGQLNAWNRNYNNWYNNNWYRMNYWGPAINTWHSPYYGYSAWNSPWYDPYHAYNGWSSSFSFHFGSSWNYGWGGYYNPWNRPYYAWDPFYSGIGWYGSGFYNPYRHYYYPGTVVVIGEPGEGRRRVEGRRPTRSSAVTDRNVSRTRSDAFDRGNSSGRYNTSTPTRRQAEYYNRSRSSSNSTFYNRQTTENNRSRWSGNSYDRYNSGGRTSSPSYSTPSRSYSTPSTSSPSRSMGSGSSGRSRGR